MYDVFALKTEFPLRCQFHKIELNRHYAPTVHYQYDSRTAMN